MSLAHHIPNMITSLRILLIVPMAYVLLQEQYGLTLLLFFVAGFSDALDGYLAKHFGWTTKIGGWLDPVADKLLMVTFFVILAMLGWIPVWLVVLAVVRDILIFSGALAYHFFIEPFRAEPLLASKLNTLFQLSLIFLTLMHAWSDFPPEWLLSLNMVAMVMTLVISGYQYVSIWSRRAMERRAQHSAK